MGCPLTRKHLMVTFSPALTSLLTISILNLGSSERRNRKILSHGEMHKNSYLYRMAIVLFYYNIKIYIAILKGPIAARKTSEFKECFMFLVQTQYFSKYFTVNKCTMQEMREPFFQRCSTNSSWVEDVLEQGIGRRYSASCNLG